jgi:hypothetical protein
MASPVTTTISTADSDRRSIPAPAEILHKIWPPAVIGFGLGLSAGWVYFLAYGLVKILRLAI